MMISTYKDVDYLNIILVDRFIYLGTFILIEYLPMSEIFINTHENNSGKRLAYLKYIWTSFESESDFFP